MTVGRPGRGKVPDNALNVYREIRDNDPVIAAIVVVIHMLLRKLTCVERIGFPTVGLRSSGRTGTD